MGSFAMPELVLEEKYKTVQMSKLTFGTVGWR
jgi:hypothetical protein